MNGRTGLEAGLTLAVLAALLRRRFRNWGATTAERKRVLVGDDLVPEPASSLTRAVEIDAPARIVWRWLVQIGQDRGGMYSYDWLENAIGLGIHSARDIREEWQTLSPGDRVVVVPPGWGPFEEGYSFPVAQVDPGRSLVLRQAPPEHPWNAVWTFVIDPLTPDRCRLISRSRAARKPGLAGWAMALMTEAMDPVTLVMTRKMLLGIKARAESSAGAEREMAGSSRA